MSRGDECMKAGRRIWVYGDVLDKVPVWRICRAPSQSERSSRSFFDLGFYDFVGVRGAVRSVAQPDYRIEGSVAEICVVSMADRVVRIWALRDCKKSVAATSS